MTIENDKLVKAMITKRYKVELFQTPSDLFVIRYENNTYNEPKYSESLIDFTMASYLFNLKCDELEGN